MSKRHYTILMLFCWTAVVIFSASMLAGLVLPEYRIVKNYPMCLSATIVQAICALYWTKARQR